MARMEFFNLLSRKITFYPFRPQNRAKTLHSNVAILEITEVSDLKEIPEVIRLSQRSLKASTGYPTNQVLDLSVMLSEMLQNIFHHAAAEQPGIVAIQRYPRRGMTQLVIADTGVGIPVTIRKSPDLRDKKLDDAAAIIEAVKVGASRLGSSGKRRGLGLARCVELAGKHEAGLYIRSNSGWAAFAMSTGHGRFGESASFGGTHICINLPEKRLDF